MDQKLTKKTPPPVSGSQGKEREVVSGSSTESFLKELGQEQELPLEVKEAGVSVRSENIEIPPDLQKMGVSPTGSQTPVPRQPTITLPLTDEKIEEGRHAPIFSSLKWLSYWCVLQLQRLHLVLKVIRGKVVRVRKD